MFLFGFESRYDESLTDGIYYRQNEAMQDAIRRLGGVTAANVPAEARQPQEDRWTRVQQERDRQAQQQINRFDGDTQNTHDPSVTRTAAGSLTSLNSFYPDLNVEQSIQEIEQHLRNFNYTSGNTFEGLTATVKKQHVNTFWEITKTRFETTHSHTGYTIKKVLALVWSAINDGRDIALTDDLKIAVAAHSSGTSDYIVDMRKSALIHQFIEANLAYRERGSDIDICIGGAVHQLLSILNKAHSQVIISTGMQSVLPDANALATTIPKQELLKRPIKEQREILKIWDLNAPDSQTADDFKNAMKPIANQKLFDVFSTLLTKQQRDDIINTFEYLPKPIVHAELDRLIEKIKAIPEDTENESRQSALARLKEQANQAYDDRDRSFEEEYELLSKVHADFVALDKLIEEIKAIPEDTENNLRQGAITRLKEQANQAYDDPDRSFEEAYKLLSKVHADFVKFDNVCKCFLKIEADYKKAISWRWKTNPSRMTSVDNIKNAVNEAYKNYYQTDHQNATAILTTLNIEISSINEDIKTDHKTGGTTALFFKYVKVIVPPMSRQ